MRVSMGVNGIAKPSASLYVPTALLARREAIAGDESGEVGGAVLAMAALSRCRFKRQDSGSARAEVRPMYDNFFDV